jgi:hypothetical protein
MAQEFFGIEACDCPDDNLGTSLAVQECYDMLAQTYRLVFLSINGAAPFDSVTNLITVEASWTTAKGLTAPDNIVLTPQVAGVVIEEGDAIINGENSNDTPKGAGIAVGHNTLKITGNFIGLTDANRQALHKVLNCRDSVQFALIDEQGFVVTRNGTEPLFFKAISTSMNGTNYAGKGELTINAFRLAVQVQEFDYRAKYDISSFYETI